MGILTNIKKGAKSYAEDFKKKSAENRIKRAKKREEQKKFNQELNARVSAVRKEAYIQEAQKQAIIKARLDAQRKFNPAPSQSGGGFQIPKSLLDPVGFSMRPAPQQKVIAKIKQRRAVKKTKKRKSSKPKTRTIVKYVNQKPQAPVRSALDKLLYDS